MSIKSGDFAQLRKFATAPIKLRAVHFNPLLDHFLLHCSKTLGVSVSEYVRRVVTNDLMLWQQNGLYRTPDAFLANPPVNLRAPLPSEKVKVSPSRLDDLPLTGTDNR